MKSLYRAVNKMFLNSLTNAYWEAEWFEGKETLKEIYEYFLKTKDDLIKDLIYEYELNEGIEFEKILEYNPYKFKKNMKPDEIYLARCEGSDESQVALANKYLNREALNSELEYDDEKIMKISANFQTELDRSIHKYIKETFYDNEAVEIQYNKELQQLFYKSDSVAVDDKEMIIYPVFKYLHYANSISNYNFKSESFPYNENNFIANPKARAYVEKEAKRIRLENNGPEQVDNESFARWIGRGFNDDTLLEYMKIYEDINFGGLYYLKEVIESSKEKMELQNYQKYRVSPIIVLYNPMTEARTLFTYNHEQVYMNTDFSQVKELQGKYQ